MINSPDFVLVEILKGYHNSLMTEDDIWNEVFSGPQRTASQINKIKNSYRDRSPEVKQGFPRADDPFPIISVIIGEGTTNTDFTGKGANTYPEVAGEDPEEVFAMVIDQTLTIGCFSKASPDLARDYSSLVFGLILGSRDAFIDMGIDGYIFNGMADLSPTTIWLPENIFGRIQTWTFTALDQRITSLSSHYKIARPPIYVGIEGKDIGDGHIGMADPSLDHQGDT